MTFSDCGPMVSLLAPAPTALTDHAANTLTCGNCPRAARPTVCFPRALQASEHQIGLKVFDEPSGEGARRSQRRRLSRAVDEIAVPGMHKSDLSNRPSLALAGAPG